jgi:hypothetical protein
MVKKCIRFHPVEITAHVSFIIGKSKSHHYTITTILLVPVEIQGNTIMPDVSLPEIFLQ